jgi:hypothetical protein
MRLDNPPRCIIFYPRPVECRSDANNSIAMIDSSTVVLYCAVALLYCAVALLYCSVALLARTVKLPLCFGFPYHFYKLALRL